MKPIIVSGKRKTAVARAVLTEGKGMVKINNIPLENIEPKQVQLKIMAPLILAGEKAKKVDLDIKSSGGGFNGQADAIKLAIGKALSEYDSTLEEVFLEYDRQLLVADVRRKEVRKPNRHGKARAKRQKSYR